MINSEIYSIFPTPIYFSKLKRNLTNEELEVVNQNKLNVGKNKGNLTSKNNYILEDTSLKNLKDELNLRVQDYFKKVISTSNNVSPYITQSWLNYTEVDQFHHKHNHDNSLVSGVFYINCHEQFDTISFFNTKHGVIKFEVKNENTNVWNADSIWYKVNTGDIILFPSSLTHMVNTKKGNNTRISLAFNVFVKGSIGNKIELTELNIN
jgi:uncharacterized protein (TIGR02466 family)